MQGEKKIEKFYNTNILNILKNLLGKKEKSVINKAER